MFEVIFKANCFFDLHAFEAELNVVHCRQVIRIDHDDHDSIAGFCHWKYFTLLDDFGWKQVKYFSLERSGGK